MPRRKRHSAQHKLQRLQHALIEFATMNVGAKLRSDLYEGHLCRTQTILEFEDLRFRVTMEVEQT